MSLRERLDQDLKEAMRAKDSARLLVIRGIKAAILATETRGERISLDEAGILQVISKELKERREAIPEFERGGREDLADKLRSEMAILQVYLPEPLSHSDLERLVEAAVNEVGAQGPKDMGKVMGHLTPEIRGRADGREVSEMVKAHLSAL